MADVFIKITPAPSTPLNLQLSVIYAPRKPTDFAGYEAIEVGHNLFQVRGHHEDGTIVFLFHGHLLQTYQRLARCLGMVEP